MKLSKREKRIVEQELVNTINLNPDGIDTRVLISIVLSNIGALIPAANQNHVFGMLSWVWKKYKYTFLVHTRGCSIIA